MRLIHSWAVVLIACRSVGYFLRLDQTAAADRAEAEADGDWEDVSDDGPNDIDHQFTLKPDFPIWLEVLVFVAISFSFINCLGCV
ncbi:hypothetical protein B0T22DRAFT_447286 [Podospora appendiculata]|uniref:Uncharacterized protein n=1 Tax=Podospora appendiculata TaxID=314037 RepID=A0AAE0XFC4_9PEZI|nr:hypothetical protein B0T22DRAFT_447286 [Podospora appendiculata]